MKRLSLLSIVLVSGSALAALHVNPASLSGAATAENRASSLAEVNDFIARLAQTASYGLDSNYNDLLNNLRDLEQSLDHSRALLLKSVSNGGNQVCGDVQSSIKEARRNFRDIVEKIYRMVAAAKKNETIIKNIYDRIESGKKSAASHVIDGINETANNLSNLAADIAKIVYASKRQEEQLRKQEEEIRKVKEGIIGIPAQSGILAQSQSKF